jgi:DNA-binding NtrC family response regulator
MLTPESYPFPSTGDSGNSRGQVRRPDHPVRFPVGGFDPAAGGRRAPGPREATNQPAAPAAPGIPSGLLVGVSQVSGLRRLEHLGEEMPPLRVLVVDDDVPVRKACCEIVAGLGFLTLAAGSATEAREVLKEQRVDMLLLDLKLPGGGGLKLLEEVKTLYPETGVVVMTAFATVSSAVEAMRVGAGDYLTKPFALEELTTVLERSSQRLHFDLESRKLRERLRTQRGMGNLIGSSPEMEKVYRILSKVAFSTHPVLILGESGTGKELVARSIHSNGPNMAKPFIPVDCGSLVPTLIESELFGYVKGAFTGANRSREGLLAAAEGGTVFLDEIGELPLDLQAKLLRALQEKEVRPVGATQAVPISARVLAATNRDLGEMVAQGLFRKDLYFRLNVVNLKIPPLRERRQDIALLAAHFLEQRQRDVGILHTFSQDAVRLMTEYDWPGNVRELEHAIERACALSSGPVLHMADLPSQLQDFRMHRDADPAAAVGTEGAGQGQADPRAGIVSIADMEKQAILGTIRQLHGDKLMAARLLGIGKTTLYRKLKEYGVAEAGETAMES